MILVILKIPLPIKRCKLLLSFFAGSEQSGGDGLQGGELRGLHDGGAEAQPEGVRVDHVQEQGGVGEQH